MSRFLVSDAGWPGADVVVRFGTENPFLESLQLRAHLRCGLRLGLLAPFSNRYGGETRRRPLCDAEGPTGAQPIDPPDVAA